MYRDDTCAVCGESLPPDHFYCREHSLTVDDRLHEIGDLLARIGEDLPRLALLLDQVAQETWDYLAEGTQDEPDWPPVANLLARAHPDDVDVDVDSEPGQVRVRLDLPLPRLIADLADVLNRSGITELTDACHAAQGANATH